MATQASASAIIDNGTIQIGVNDLGDLNVPGGTPSETNTTSTVGLRYLPTNAEATADGCTCEGWGAADSISGVTGYANTAVGDGNVSVVSFTSTASTATSVVDIGSTLRVKQEYKPSPATPNLYQDTVTITNLSSATVDARYRRVMDWDIEPTPFDEYSTVDGSPFPELLYTSDNGFASANPLSGPSQILASGFFTDSGPADHGALFDFDLGSLAAGKSVTSNVFYGGTGTEKDANAAIDKVGAETWSFGQPDTAGGPTLGTPNTFIFAFSAVGGDPIAGEDARPPVALRLFAPPSIAGGADAAFRANLKNVGRADASDVSATITVPAGLTLKSGAATQSFGTLTPGSSVDANWTVTGPKACADKTYTVPVTASFKDPDGTVETRSTSRDLVVTGDPSACGAALATGDGISHINTAFSFRVTGTPSAPSGHASFTGSDGVVRSGDVTCANVSGKKIVFGIKDTSSTPARFREFFAEDNAAGDKLAELNGGTVYTYDRPGCRRSATNTSGDLIHSGNIAIGG